MRQGQSRADHQTYVGTGITMTSLFQKLFLTNSYFTIALRPRGEQSVLSDPAFQPQYVLPARARRWAADPMLAEEAGKTWLFYEAVEDDHGHIEAAEVLPDCSLGEATVILKDECHYSYPFVFQWEGRWYMIPESSGAKEVRLYEAEAFPFRWRLREILLRERAVDTTVFEQDGQLYLLTFLTDGSSERVTPRAYALQLRESGSRLSPIPWAAYDSLRVRGAGPLFREDGMLCRPAQVSREQIYGDAVALYRVTAEDATYREEPLGTLTTPRGRCAGAYVDGAHTYCRASRFEAVDLRCRDFDLWKLPRRLLGRRKK